MESREKTDIDKENTAGAESSGAKTDKTDKEKEAECCDGGKTSGCDKESEGKCPEDAEKKDGAEDEQDDMKGGSKKLKAENKKLIEEKKELDEKYKRVLAEYDNFRKRAAKEREGVYADAYADALKEILGVKDSLELALKYPDSEKVVEGVSMTLTKFADTLKKLGVEEFGESGEAFDPNLHNAVMHVEDENLGENEIADVLLKGYKKGDKIIRYAMVKVAN